MPIPGKREHQEGGTAGTKVEVGARHVASPKLVLSAFVSLLSPVRLVPPHSLQVVRIETHRCNITWTVSQVSHYIQNDVEFEARLRYADHSWEVSAWLRRTCPDSSLSWLPCPSFISAKPQKPLINPSCSLELPPTTPLWGPLTPQGSSWHHIQGKIYKAKRQVTPTLKITEALGSHSSLFKSSVVHVHGG